MSEAICQLCGQPMPEGEEMFNYHGYSGNCPSPPVRVTNPDKARDAAYSKYLRESDARGEPISYSDFEHGWNAAEKYTRQRIADELQELRDDTDVDMLWTRIDDYIEQLCEGKKVKKNKMNNKELNEKIEAEMKWQPWLIIIAFVLFIILLAIKS